MTSVSINISINLELLNKIQEQAKKKGSDTKEEIIEILKNNFKGKEK